MALSKVIHSLSLDDRKRPKHINYRDSKLTRILQPSLSGNALMTILCCASASNLYTEETRSTLKFASCAKLIKTDAKKNEVLDDGALIKRLQRELATANAALKILEKRFQDQEKNEPIMEEQQQKVAGLKSLILSDQTPLPSKPASSRRAKFRKYYAAFGPKSFKPLLFRKESFRKESSSASLETSDETVASIVSKKSNESDVISNLKIPEDDSCSSSTAISSLPCMKDESNISEEFSETSQEFDLVEDSKILSVKKTLQAKKDYILFLEGQLQNSRGHVKSLEAEVDSVRKKLDLIQNSKQKVLRQTINELSFGGIMFDESKNSKNDGQRRVGKSNSPKKSPNAKSGYEQHLEKMLKSSREHVTNLQVELGLAEKRIEELKVSKGGLEVKLGSAGEKIVELEKTNEILELKMMNVENVKKARIGRNKCCLLSLFGPKNKFIDYSQLISSS